MYFNMCCCCELNRVGGGGEVLIAVQGLVPFLLNRGVLLGRLESWGSTGLPICSICHQFLQYFILY